MYEIRVAATIPCYRGAKIIIILRNIIVEGVVPQRCPNDQREGSLHYQWREPQMKAFVSFDVGKEQTTQRTHGSWVTGSDR